MHHLTSSLILTNHRRILKIPQNGFLQGIFSSVPTVLRTDESYEEEVLVVVEQQYMFLSRSSTLQFFTLLWLNLNPTGMFWDCLFKAMYGQIPQADNSGKMDSASENVQEKLLAKCSGKITFFRVSWVPKQCSRIFKVSNACTNLWNHMMEETAGSRRRNPKKESRRMGMNFSGFWFHCPSVFKAGWPNPDKSKLV